MPQESGGKRALHELEQEHMGSLVNTVRSLEMIARSPHLQGRNIQFYPRIGSEISLPDLARFVEKSAAYIASKVR